MPSEPAPQPPRRRLRRTRWVGAALLTSLVVLVITVVVGAAMGANEIKWPWQKRAVGATGEVIWLNNCAACHGRDGSGGIAFDAPGLTPGSPLAGLTFDERVAKISRGKPLRNMPAWKFQISEDDIRRVAAYTQLLSGQTPEPTVEEVR